MLNTPLIFDRYQQVRERAPRATTGMAIRDVGSLLDLVHDIDAFVFDAFGVLNVGNTLIEGASARLRELRALGCRIRILTNAASYDHAAAVAKFQRFGLLVAEDEIVTSRQAAITHLDSRAWGVIAAPDDQLSDLRCRVTRLEDDPAAYDAVDGVLFLSSSGWTDARQRVLCQSLLDAPRPVLVANPDLVAPRDDGFSLEPGHYAHLLIDKGVESVRFFGKPYPEVYQLIEASLPGVPAARIAMCGDTLHTDIVGAAARHWRTVLVTQDGLFAGYETRFFCEEAGLFPDWRVARI
ncbi:MAG: HAD family hydrolase [Pseudomonadota bacterium]